MLWLKSLLLAAYRWSQHHPIPLRQDFCSSSICTIESQKVLMVQFRGITDNSNERSHIYEAMDKRLTKLLAREQPAGLIFDLRELEYDWGDDMGVSCPWLWKKMSLCVQ